MNMREMANYNPMIIRNWISEIDSWLSTHRPQYYSKLLPGLTKQEIEALELSIGYKLPEAFCQFFAWKNGQLDCEVGIFINNLFLLNAAGIAEEVTFFREELSDQPEWFHRAWIPFMRNYQGDVLCIDMEGSFGGRPGQVLMFYHDDPMRVIEFSSFDKWLETFAFAMKNNLLSLIPADEVSDKDNVSETVDFRQAYKRIDPGMPVYVNYSESIQ